MKTNKNSIRLAASLGVAALIMAPSAFAAPHTVTEAGGFTGPTAGDLVDILMNGYTGITVGGETYNGIQHNAVGTVDAWDTTTFPNNFGTIAGHAAIGSFTGGAGLPATGLPFNSGVILSTGSIDSVLGPVQTGSISPNNSPRTSTVWNSYANFFQPVVSAGSAMLAGPNYDAASLSFNFTVASGVSSFYFQYAFASDEYDQAVLFDDAFAIFLTDLTLNTAPVNIALLADNVTPVSVSSTYNTSYYVSNPYGTTDYAIEYDGIAGGAGADPLYAVADNLLQGHQYRIDIVVADLQDQAGDSAVFIGAGIFVSNPVPEPATYVGALALGSLVAARMRRRK